MRAITIILLATGLLGLSGDALAAGKVNLKSLEIKGETGMDSSMLIVIAVVVVVVIVLVSIFNRATSQRPTLPAKTATKKPKIDFKKHAAQLGFKIAEIKTLRLIAAKVAPQNPSILLTTDEGRERLSTSILDRIGKREREIEILREIQSKLGLMRDHEMQERATIRVETNLQVWIVKKTDSIVDPETEEEEDIFTDVEQVGGQLLDLSEGGAALTADLDVKENDLIELWSADSEIWIPPITAGVLRIKQDSGGRGPIFHLNFLDPPLSELRAAIQTLQMEAEIRPS